MTGILYDRRNNAKLKAKVYNTSVKLAMLFEAETWATKNAQETRPNVTEMKMLRWMPGVTKLDKIRRKKMHK